jgi:hypothetical protein
MKSSLVIVAFLFLPSVAGATDYLPSDVKTHLAEYSGKYKIILAEAKNPKDPSIPMEERLARFQAQLDQLRNEFGGKRTKEYQSKSTSRSVSHSCTKKSSGGKKDCGYKCVDSPSPDLYTTRQWVKVAGDDKGTSISETQACLRMTRAGKGRNAGTLTARFEYKPASISRLVRRDTDVLFQLVVEGAGTVALQTIESADFVDERNGSLALEDPGTPDHEEAPSPRVE